MPITFAVDLSARARVVKTGWLALVALAALTSASHILAQGTPAAPSNLAFRVSGDTVELSWQPGVGNGVNFVIEAGSAAGSANLATMPATGTAVSVTAVPPGVYFVRVRALVAGILGAPSNEVTITVSAPVAPGPPTNFTATVRGSTVILAWIAPAGGSSPEGYLVQVGSLTGASNLASIPVAGLSMTAHGAAAGTYYLRVLATNRAGTSMPSNEAVAVVVGSQPPAAPTDLAYTVNDSSVSLTWTAPAAGGMPDWYIVEAGSSQAQSNVARITVAATNLQASSVANGLYFLRVRAANSVGTSAPSNEVSVLVGPRPVPHAPLMTRVRVAVRPRQMFPDSAQLQVSWAPPVTGPAVTGGYIVEVGSAPGLFDVSRTPLCTTTCNWSANVDVRRRGPFYVRVRGVNESGEGAPGNEVVATAAYFVNGIPISGGAAAPLPALDTAMTTFMNQRGITAASLAVSLGPRVYVERVYGWQGRDGLGWDRELYSAAPFRLASVSKPITAALVRRLIDQGRLSLTDKAFCTGVNQPCRLQITPFGTPPSALGRISVQHLLEHQGGWDSAISGDPMFNLRNIAQQMGLVSQIGKADIVRWLTGRPLDFLPGERSAYSNVGYLVLGSIVEQAGGRPFMEQVAELMAPFASGEVHQGRSLPADRFTGEPAYEDPYTTLSLFPPYPVVPWPDGGLLMEAFQAHGGLIASSHAIARFLANYWITGEPRVGGTASMVFYGTMPGTLTMARQLPTGVNVAVFFNRRVDTANAIINPDAIRLALDPVVQQINWSALDQQ